MSKNILVTGAAGCVGANLVKKLVADNIGKVSILIKPGTWHPFLNNVDIKVYYGDIRDIGKVMRAMEGCDIVFQVAGVVSYNIIDNDEMYTTHVEGVKNVLDAAKSLGVKKVIVTASTAGIGIAKSRDFPLNEDSSFDLRIYKKVMYMYSKYLCIQLCQKYSKEGLDVSVVSPTTIYGQGDMSMHIGKLVKKIKEGRVMFAPPGGNSVVSVDDIIDAHILVMEKGKSGENYIFANEFMSYLEMFNRIANLTNVNPIKITMPAWILSPTKLFLNILEKTMSCFGKKPILSPSSLNFSFKYRHFDSSKARIQLGWKPKVDFDSAIKKAIGFYKENKLV